FDSIHISLLSYKAQYRTMIIYTFTIPTSTAFYFYKEFHFNFSTLPPLALQLPEHCMHVHDVTSVTHSRQTRKIQTLIVLPIRSGNKENPGKL
ncbi:TPA: hypothetical protein ACHJUA_002615, partial [Escherichia coli]